MNKKIIRLIDFNVAGRGFEIEYHAEGTKDCPEDKYWIFFIDGKKTTHLISLREDECILLSALLNWDVHKKLVEVDGVGCLKPSYKTGGKEK